MFTRLIHIQLTECRVENETKLKLQQKQKDGNDKIKKTHQTTIIMFDNKMQQSNGAHTFRLMCYYVRINSFCDDGKLQT